MASADSTRLTDINAILRLAGLPVTSTLSTTRRDVALADQLLEDTDLEVQSRGWWFNRAYSVELQPNVDGEIVLDGTVIRLDGAEWRRLPGGPYNGCQQLTKRGGRVYDLTDRTFVFTGPVTVDFTERLEYADLPQEVRTYVRARAARLFYHSVREDESSTHVENERQALMDLMAAESDQDELNFFKDSPSARQAFRSRHRNLPTE